MIKIRIESDSMDDSELKAAVKIEDFDFANQKIKAILSTTKKVVDKQNQALDSEFEHSELQLKFSQDFLYLTVAQTIIILVIGVYHLFSLRKYLLANNII